MELINALVRLIKEKNGKRYKYQLLEGITMDFKDIKRIIRVL